MKNIIKQAIYNYYNNISEADMSTRDHHRVQIVQIKPLEYELKSMGYKCTLLSKSAKELKGVQYDMILKRHDGESRYVKVIRRRRTTDTANVMIPIGKFDDNTFTLFDDPKINEICLICPPHLNYDPYGQIVDNTKACFFDKDQLLDAYINNKLKAVTTRDGDSIVVPDRWAKDNAKEVVSYKYKK